MKMFGLHLGEIHDVDLDQLRAAAPTYDHVGSTLHHPRDNSANCYESQVTAGNGRPAFTAAREALRQWRPQRSLGASITPEHAAPNLGETVVLGLGIGPLRLNIPNRIVAVVDEPDRYGYAYGSLPGHPERGEELFLVEITATGPVVITIRVDAEPSSQLRSFGFLIHPLQRLALRRYLTTIADATEPSEPLQ